MHLAIARWTVPASLAFLLASALPARANLVVNGGFEAGVPPALSDGRCCYSVLPSGSTDITGWTVTRNAINYTDGYFQTFAGTRCLDLNHFAGGGIAQPVSTQPGKRYVVTFDLAGNPIAGTSPMLKRVRVEAAGHFAEFDFDATGWTPENMGWSFVSWDFVASASTTILEIYSLIGGGEGPAIDNVVVDFPVPIDLRTWGRIKSLYL